MCFYLFSFSFFSCSLLQPLEPYGKKFQFSEIWLRPIKPSSMYTMASLPAIFGFMVGSQSNPYGFLIFESIHPSQPIQTGDEARHEVISQPIFVQLWRILPIVLTAILLIILLTICFNGNYALLDSLAPKWLLAAFFSINVSSPRSFSAKSDWFVKCQNFNW